STWVDRPISAGGTDRVRRWLMIRVARRPWPFVTILIVAVYGVVPHAQPAPDPLRLMLECSQTSELTFRFTLQNVSQAPTAVVIGAILGNDKKYLLQDLGLVVRRGGVVDTLLEYVDPSVAGVAGRIDPWLVTLPPGSSYSITAPARHFAVPP